MIFWMIKVGDVPIYHMSIYGFTDLGYWYPVKMVEISRCVFSFWKTTTKRLKNNSKKKKNRDKNIGID